MLTISHYSLAVRLEFAIESFPHSAPGSLHVKACLQVQNAGPEPASALPLVFYRLHQVSDVTVNNQEATVTSRLTGLAGLERHHVNAVVIQLPEALPPGASCTVSLEYGGVAAGAREVWPYIWDSVTREYTLLRPDSIWYPVASTPDKASYDAADMQPKHFDVTVHVPEGYTAVAPGLVTKEGGIARFQTAAPRERFDLAVAPFARLHNNGVSVYYLPGDNQWGTCALAWVTAALNGLSRRLGARDTGELDIAQVPTGWGSQNTPNLILQEAGSPDDWCAAAQVVHEVSHFWTPTPPGDWPKRFSDESLASFFQYILVGDLFGPEKAEEQLERFQRAVDRVQGAAEAKFLDEHLRDGLHNAVWYAKGALALNSLRNQLGDGQFWPLLQQYTREQKATAAGFVELLTRHYPGPETDAFVHHWFG